MAELITTFGIDWRLLIIQGVNFAVLLAALSYLLYKPVMRALDERAALAEKGVRDAKRAEEKLHDAEKESRMLVGKAAEEAEHMVMKAREHAVQKGAQIEADAKARAESAVREAEQRAAALTVEALREAEAGIAKAAVLAAERILRGKA